MDTFEDLEDLLDVFGLGNTISNSQCSQEVPDADVLNDNDVDEISVDNLVENFLVASAQVDVSGDAHEETGVNQNDIIDEDDPQRDLVSVKQRLEDGCGCKLYCFKDMSESVVLDNILRMREMSKDNKELFVMGKLREKLGTDRCKEGERQRVRYNYDFQGKKICQKAFCLIYDMGKNTVKRIQKHVSRNGIGPRVHGLIGRRPANAFSSDVVKNAVQFLINYAVEEGLPQPSPPKGRDDTPPIYLPASKTKISIHQEYVEACQKYCKVHVGRSTFKDLWNRCVPHIKIMNPRDDVCKTCEDFRDSISMARSEDDKLEATSNYHKHVLSARAERGVYQQCIQDSTALFQGIINNYSKVHYTFDFSQYVKLPHHTREKGPTFFVQPRKVQIFGFRIDGHRQYNYLIDEDQTIGADGQLAHGPDSVIFMLDHAFSAFCHQGGDCTIHADNCFGQNKNRFVIAYLSWRTMTKRHENIKFMMQLPGHTRCLIDAGFGRIKQRYRREDVDTLQQVADVVDSSSCSNISVVYGRDTWKWRQWKTFFGDKFKKVPNISKYHYFRFTSNDPGAVYMKASAVEPTRFVVCKTNLLVMDSSDIPLEIIPAGLSQERQRYLFTHVRPLARLQFQDVFCPAPAQK